MIYLYNSLSVAFDAKSKREIIGDRLYIRDCILTSATVNDYLGSEIKGYQELGLDANTKYGILRPLSELKKAVKSYEGNPLLYQHSYIDYNANPDKSKWMGSTGTNARIEGNDLKCDVIVWDKKLIEKIQNPNSLERLKDLSCGYTYSLVLEEGTYEGKQYKFKMIDLIGNHLAVVPDGRVERAQLSDSNKINNRFLKGIKKMKSPLMFFFNDKRATDERDLLRGMKEIADRDPEDFEGGEIEQAKAICELAKKIEAAERIEDNDEDKKMKDKKARDESEEERKKSEDEEDDEDMNEDKKARDKKMKDKKARDESEEERKKSEDEEEKEKAMDAAINKRYQERLKVEALTKKVLGNISPSILLDHTPEQLVTRTLKAKKIACDNKSYETKMAMLETLAAVQDSTPAKFIQDNNYDYKPKYVSAFDKKGDK